MNHSVNEMVHEKSYFCFAAHMVPTQTSTAPSHKSQIQGFKLMLVVTGWLSSAVSAGMLSIRI